MKLLIFPSAESELPGKIKSISDKVIVAQASTEEEAAEKITDAEALYGRVTPGLLRKATRLRWVQAPIAGLERYIFPELAKSDVILTNMRGIYSDHIADHVFGFIFGLAKGFHVYARRQLERKWQPDYPTIHLSDQTLGIIGFGGIGSEVAKRGAICGMRVLAVDPKASATTPKPDFVDELWEPDQLLRLLKESDFIVISAPHTPETEKMIGETQLRQMKKSAYLINIGRGVIVDLKALTVALQEKWIAGAGLDVFEIEPLPKEHPLWSMDNVIITPHVAGFAPHTAARRHKVLLENLHRFMANQPLLNVVDKKRWF